MQVNGSILKANPNPNDLTLKLIPKLSLHTCTWEGPYMLYSWNCSINLQGSLLDLGGLGGHSAPSQSIPLIGGSTKRKISQRFRKSTLDNLPYNIGEGTYKIEDDSPSYPSEEGKPWSG